MNPDSLRRRAFLALARLDLKHPWLVVAAALALTIWSILYARNHLEFRTGQDDLISSSTRDSRNYLAYTKEFPDIDGLVVVIRADSNPVRAEAFADSLARKLAADPANVKSVFYKIAPGLFADRALLYLPSADLRELATRLRDNSDLLARYAADPGLANLFTLINEQTSRAMASHLASGLFGGSSASSSSTQPLDLSLIDSILKGMLAAPTSRFQSPWRKLFGGGAEKGLLRDGYVASDNGKYLLMQIAQADALKDGPDPVDVIERDLDLTRGQFQKTEAGGTDMGGIEAGMTGSPALAHAEASSTARDVALASVLAIVANVLLLVIPFRGFVRPAFAIVALLAGTAWSFGFTALAIGHLNLLSAVFMSVLAGIGINFPIHLMARYDEARREGHSLATAVELSVVNTGSGVVASAIIMSLAFLAPTFTDFKGVAELGEVSAAGVFLCLLAAMLLFPAMLVLRDRGRRAIASIARPFDSPPTMLSRLFSNPRRIILVTLVITALGAYAIRNLRFDQNLLKLQAENSEAVRFEEKLLKDSGRSSWFAVSLASTREEADHRAEQFRKLTNVSDAETISSYIPDDQSQKRAILASLKPILDPISVRSLSRPSDSGQLLDALNGLAFKLGGAPAGSGSSPSKTAALVRQVISQLEHNSRSFDSYESAMAQDIAAKISTLKSALAPAELTESNLPAIIRDRFVGASGKYLVQIYPRGDVWDDAPLRRFVDSLRTVDADVTGPPIQTFSIASVMRTGYERAAVLALAGVLIFVFADFRKWRDTLLATVPLFFGAAWMLEAMGLLGWEFNLANLFAVPVIIGMGVDNGVNMVYRWREEKETGQLILRKAVGKSVTICSLTTIAGFAALIPASHRGISSLGWTLSLGVTFILIATLILLPAIFELIGSSVKTEAVESDPLCAPTRTEVKRAASGTLIGAAVAIAGMLVPVAARAQSSPALVIEAEQLINQAGREDPINTTKIVDAVGLLKRAIALDPNNDAAYVDLGFAYSVQKQPDDALDMYKKAVKINPSAANFTELADIYLRLGRPDAALMAANAGLTKAPRDAHLYNARGMAYNDMMRFPEAEKDFRLALSLDPSLEAAKVNLKAIGSQHAGSHTISKSQSND
jgi:hopanoid biosynthesis associated RND transporter like protein HpnN